MLFRSQRALEGPRSTEEAIGFPPALLTPPVVSHFRWLTSSESRGFSRGDLAGERDRDKDLVSSGPSP